MVLPPPGDKNGGGKGIRTPGLLIANETLYQLSYTPFTERRRINAQSLMGVKRDPFNYQKKFGELAALPPHFTVAESQAVFCRQSRSDD